jgi:lysophospholipase L1-like esterase
MPGAKPAGIIRTGTPITGGEILIKSLKSLIRSGPARSGKACAMDRPVSTDPTPNPGLRVASRASEDARRQFRVRLAALSLLIILPVFVLGGVEVLARVPLQQPAVLRSLPWQLISAYKTYYMFVDRDIIQYNPHCAHYDKDLFYTLKPGSCTFANREFSTSISVNSLGVRDDEASLLQPQVAVLGDSEAMGWGVEQDETYAQIIEHQSGMKVLNAAISSYGTARELKMLNKIDHSRLAYVVIQYCSNDISENEEFLAHDGVLPIRNEAAYRAAASGWNDRWKPWASTYLLRELWSIARPPAQAAATAANATSVADPIDREASEFVQVLARGAAWDGIKLIVMEINAHRDNKPRWADAVRRELQADGIPSALRAATVLDPSSFLTPDDYYTLDYEHINRQGHRAVASHVLDAVRRARDTPGD